MGFDWTLCLSLEIQSNIIISAYVHKIKYKWKYPFRWPPLHFIFFMKLLLKQSFMWHEYRSWILIVKNPIRKNSQLENWSTRDRCRHEQFSKEWVSLVSPMFRIQCVNLAHVSWTIIKIVLLQSQDTYSQLQI